MVYRIGTQPSTTRTTRKSSYNQQGDKRTIICLVAKHCGVLELGKGWNNSLDLLHQELAEIQALYHGFELTVILQVPRLSDDRMVLQSPKCLNGSVSKHRRALGTKMTLPGHTNFELQEPL